MSCLASRCVFWQNVFFTRVIRGQDEDESRDEIRILLRPVIPEQDFGEDPAA